ncbi:RDD family protein [Betaproteobacteria bacterium]|nr:RDD family protein [Betaproteobacteria bacterium]GHU04309.1 RDD family protein [Betaproteobacteria bacterium]GHU16670.1 RDD family protein [Betaproteobacteria bacterium]
MSIPDDFPQATTSKRPVVELASRRRRLVSMVYESLLLLGVLGVAVMLPCVIAGMVWEWAPPGWLLWSYIFVVFGFYFVGYWHRLGRTLAMQTWRLQVVTAADGGKPTLERALLRYVLAWPSVLLCGVGLLWSLFDLDDLFLHDRLAGTRVVVLPR